MLIMAFDFEIDEKAENLLPIGMDPLRIYKYGEFRIVLSINSKLPRRIF